MTAAAQLTGLQAGATYHFRLVATNSAGIAQGDDVTFTTLTRAPAAPPASQPTGGRQYSGFHFRFRLYPDVMVLRRVVADAIPPGYTLTISCARCTPRVRSAHHTSALAGVRVPKGGVLILRQTRRGYRGTEMRLRLRDYGTSRAEMLRVADAIFIRSDRSLPVS